MSKNVLNSLNNNFLPVLFLIAIFISASSISNAQSPRFKKPTNLKVLPADISGEKLDAIMDSFTSGLGVHCNFCHEDPKNNDFRNIDFASDVKPTKQAARVMMQMVNAINGTDLKDAKKYKADIGNVKCVTCHRGSPTIDMLEDVLFATYQKSGYDAMLAKYDDLRKQYYGGFTYDFRDHTLLSLASKINDAGNFDDAVKVVNKDIDLYPQSPNPLIFLANVYMKKGNKEEATNNLEKALKIDPNNRFAGEMLRRIQNPDKK